MRVMAIDYGDARTGIAVSDTTLTLTGDAWVVSGKNINELARLISDEAESRDVSAVVIGYPKNMDGSAGGSAKKSERLAAALRDLTSAEVKFWDERLTTVSAHRILTETGKRGKKRKQTIDAVAASLILESYLGSL